MARLPLFRRRLGLRGFLLIAVPVTVLVLLGLYVAVSRGHWWVFVLFAAALTVVSGYRVVSPLRDSGPHQTAGLESPDA